MHQAEGVLDDRASVAVDYRHLLLSGLLLTNDQSMYP